MISSLWNMYGWSILTCRTHAVAYMPMSDYQQYWLHEVGLAPVLIHNHYRSMACPLWFDCLDKFEPYNFLIGYFWYPYT